MFSWIATLREDPNEEAILVSLRDEERGTREEEARITLSVISRSTALGTLANVF